ncbi:DUF6332 family protein [Streptomyces subrutilus]|uniref:Uncharacterized protein n=1 Tax=Streptomyces subrutilus TaxID=36818 RepID=A0A1E5PLC5_9ACTN|nr:DUF6332 family protein [Streptomyces subrutilus]OEJ30361.1 hypothetical protein BGK67_02420 [Streptomyces subrutilus]
MTTTRRTQAERDEITVEIGYALLSACFLGAVVFATIAGPVAVWDFAPAVEKSLLVAGAWVGGVLAVIRVVHVLWRYGQRNQHLADPCEGQHRAASRVGCPRCG